MKPTIRIEYMIQYRRKKSRKWHSRGFCDALRDARNSMRYFCDRADVQVEHRLVERTFTTTETQKVLE